MRFNEAIEDALRDYARFRGRARRSQFWWFVLFAALLNTAGFVLIDLVGLFTLPRPPGGAPSELGTLVTVVIGCSLAILDLLLLPLLAVNVRRFHDVGLSGWWYASTIAIDLLAAFQNPKTPVPYLPGLVLAALLATLVVACLRGHRGANRYGGGGDAISEVFAGAGAAAKTATRTPH